MTWVDLLFFPPLLLAVSVVVGAAGRQPGEIATSIRHAFVALGTGVIVLGLIVRLIVLLFA